MGFTLFISITIGLVSVGSGVASRVAGGCGDASRPVSVDARSSGSARTIGSTTAEGGGSRRSGRAESAGSFSRGGGVAIRGATSATFSSTSASRGGRVGVEVARESVGAGMGRITPTRLARPMSTGLAAARGGRCDPLCGISKENRIDEPARAMPSRAARDTGLASADTAAPSVSSMADTSATAGLGDRQSTAGSRGSGVEVRGAVSSPRRTADTLAAGAARRVGALSNFLRVERTTSGGGRSVSRSSGVGRRGGRAERERGGRGEGGGGATGGDTGGGAAGWVTNGGGGEGDGGCSSSRVSRRLNASTERARLTKSRRVVPIIAGGAATEAGRGGRELGGRGAGGGRSSSRCSSEVARRSTDGRRRGASRSARLR